MTALARLAPLARLLRAILFPVDERHVLGGVWPGGRR